MSAPKTTPKTMKTSDVLAIIMGGGQGTRLFPLTKERSKPAVPLGGKYRLVDIPISNCINADLKRIYLLTQFNSASLHRHIAKSYKFDHFSKGFVEILAAEQTPQSTTWYEGTADAVRKNRIHFEREDCKYILILSGDQLYRMDFQEILDDHLNSGAEITIATMPVRRSEVPSLGIIEVDRTGKIKRFVEKPSDPAVQETLRLHREWYSELGIQGDEELFLASMGIYVFNRDTLFKLLENDMTDFGKHIIPKAIDTRSVRSHVFQGYWEDVGTIRAFFEANINLTADLPAFNFFNMLAPIFTRPRFLPGSKINKATIDHAVVSDGCIISDATIKNSIIGLRCVVGHGTFLNRCVLMGCDYYEAKESIEENAQAGNPPIGIGANCHIENAIVDKNARIGNNVRITPEGKPENMDAPEEGFYIRDGIVIIPKNAVIHHGQVI